MADIPGAGLLDAALGRLFGARKLSAAIWDRDWKRVSRKCRKRPRLAKHWTLQRGFLDGETTTKVLPLHQAVITQPPLRVVQDLIDANHQSLRCGDLRFNRLPLHLACEGSASFRLIRELIDRYPEACLVQDKRGLLPLHYALTKGASFMTIAHLLDHGREAASYPDECGELPLHKACTLLLSPMIVQELVEAYPEACEALTSSGQSIERTLLRHPESYRIEVMRVLDDETAVQQSEGDGAETMNDRIGTTAAFR